MRETETVARRFEDLTVWQRAMDLTVAIYHVSAKWPEAEMFGLTSEIRRAAIAIPSQIASGHSRALDDDFGCALDDARASLAEVETQLILAGRLDFLTESELEPLLEMAGEVGRLLNGLLRTLDKGSRN
jgi:four helix bundle protein